MLIDIQDSTYKDLKKLDKSDAIKILQTIKKLEDYPNITNVKKLTNHYPPFRLRIGDYRVLFDIEENKIIISNIKHRKEAY